MVRQPPQSRPKRHRPRAVHAKRLPEDEHVKGSIEMLELGARYENGKYVGRWREYDNTEDSEEETDDEDETAFWAYESRNTDTARLLNGEMTDSNCDEYMEALKALAADGRLLVAGGVLDKIETYVSLGGAGAERVKRMLEEEKLAKVVSTLGARVPEVKQALVDLESDENWIFAQTLFGISTYFRRNEDGSVRIKLDGVMQGIHAFDMFAVLKEADMYRNWAPCCAASRVVHEVSKTELVLWFHVLVPLLLSRDCCMHVYTCDYTEAGSVIFIGGSTSSMDGVELPQRLDGWGADRMEIRDFRAQCSIISTRSCGLKVICTIDPKAHLPQSLLNFCIKKIAGMLIYLLEREAHKMNTHADTHHLAIRIRDSPFYETFLLPRVEDYTRQQGWVMEALPSLQVPRDPQAKPVKRHRADRNAARGEGPRRRRARSRGEGAQGVEEGGHEGGRPGLWRVRAAELWACGGEWGGAVLDGVGALCGHAWREVVEVGGWVGGEVVPRLWTLHSALAMLIVAVWYLMLLCFLSPRLAEARGQLGVVLVLQAGIAALLLWEGWMTAGQGRKGPRGEGARRGEVHKSRRRVVGPR